MNCKIDIIPRLLHFKQPAGTSRGVYTTRKVWYLHLTSPDYPGRTGIGECAPLPALSCDDLPDYEDILVKACRREIWMWSLYAITLPFCLGWRRLYGISGLEAGRSMIRLFRAERQGFR